MTTARTVWLGFGTLTALLVLSGVAILLRVQSIEKRLDALANGGGITPAVVQALEGRVGDYALGVHESLHGGGPEALAAVQADAAAVEREHAGYARLASTEQQRQLATRFGALWAGLHQLGGTILDEAHPLSREDVLQLRDRRTELERFLHDELRAEAAEGERARRAETVQDVQAIVGFALLLLVAGVLIVVVTSAAVVRGIVRAEAQVHANRDLLRAALASIGDAVITTDIGGRVTSLNSVAASLTGWTLDAAAGRPLEDVFRIINGQTRQPVANSVKHVLAEGKVFGLAKHTVLLSQGGAEHLIDDSAAPIRDVNGKVLGVVLVFRDVGDRQEAERRVRDSESRKAALIEASLDCIINLDHEGRIAEFNPAAERTFGFRRDDVVGQPMSERLIPPSLRDRFRQALAPVLATGEGALLGQRVELTGLRADGLEFPLEVSLTRIPVEGPPAFAAFVRDITAQREAQAVVRESELRYRRLFEAAHDGILILDADRGIVTDANPFMSTLLGYSHDEFLGRELWEIGLFEDIQASKVAVLRLQTERYVRYEHLPLVSRTGRKIDVEFVSNVYTEGQHTVIQCNIRDITERKRLQDELEQHAADLAEADRRKDEFLAMLAHELRNPLAPLRNALQVIRLKGAEVQGVAAAAEMMERQVSQMVRLVDDLLDASRSGRGKIELRKGRIELASAVNHAVAAARSLVQSTAHELTVTLPIVPIYLRADPTRLAQVVGNLLGNACKFTDKGGHIWLTLEREGQTAVISVRDNGIGIAPDQLPHIFEMFMQVDSSLERSRSGLGIGLTMVKSLVELHEGTVEAHSAGLGRGCEFVVRLPIPVEAAEPPLTELPVLQSIVATPRRILVVDDNRDSAQSLAMLLELTGNVTHTAYDGLEAVEAAEAFRPEIVLLDIGLPKLNGYEAARKIREEPWGQSLVLVALTGWGQEEDRRKSKEAGFNGHMVKPVEHAALIRLLSDLMPLEPVG